MVSENIARIVCLEDHERANLKRQVERAERPPVGNTERFDVWNLIGLKDRDAFSKPLENDEMKTGQEMEVPSHEVVGL